MRQPLQILVDALPDTALRPLLLELLGVVSAAPLIASYEHKPTDATEGTTPAPPAKHAGGRPRGSRNKAKAPAVVTGARKAAKLAAQPGRESIVRAVANGELTQAAGARQIGCTAKTLGTWVVRYRSEHKPAATPTDGESAAAHAPAGAREPAPQAAKPAPAKRLSGPAGETPAQRAERLAKHAARQRERDAERRQQRDAERAAQAAQMRLPISGNGNGEDAARSAISAVRPAAAKPNVDPAAEAALAAKLWQHAAALDPTAPWRPIVQEFGINSAVAVDLYRSGSFPPIAPAAATRFCAIAHN
jgi:transposase-like protein